MGIKAIISPQKKKKSKDSIQATPIVMESNPLHEFRGTMLNTVPRSKRKLPHGS